MSSTPSKMNRVAWCASRVTAAGSWSPFITAISSAFGYLTPAAQPAFTIIYASGFLKGSDFFKIGIRMMLISFAVLLLLATGVAASRATPIHSRPRALRNARSRCSPSSRPSKPASSAS